jgi:hypothetical protein
MTPRAGPMSLALGWSHRAGARQPAHPNRPLVAAEMMSGRRRPHESIPPQCPEMRSSQPTASARKTPDRCHVIRSHHSLAACRRAHSEMLDMGGLPASGGRSYPALPVSRRHAITRWVFGDRGWRRLGRQRGVCDASPFPAGGCEWQAQPGREASMLGGGPLLPVVIGRRRRRTWRRFMSRADPATGGPGRSAWSFWGRRGWPPLGRRATGRRRPRRR